MKDDANGCEKRKTHCQRAAKAVGGGYCRLQMPLSLALAARDTVAGHRLGALEGGGGNLPPPSNTSPDPGTF